MKLTKQERSWILYDVANSAYTLIIGTAIMPIFFKSVASKGVDSAVSTSNWAFANSSASFMLALLAPVLGAIADNRGVKKKLLMLFMFTGMIFTALFSMVGEGDWILCTVFFIITNIGFAGANVFYDAFLPDVTTGERMDWVSSSGFGWGNIGSVVPFIIGMAMITKPALFGFGSTLAATKAVFIVTAVWWFIFSLPIVLHVKQVNFVAHVENPIRSSFIRLARTLRDIKKYKNVFLFVLAYFFYIDGVYTIIKMATAYAIELGLNSTQLLLIVLVIQIVAFPCALIFGLLAKRFSAKKMILAGIGVYTIIVVIAFSMAYIDDMKTKMIFFWLMAMLVAAAQGGIQSLSRSYYGKIIPKDKSAEFFGFYDIFGKFAAILGPLLMGIAARSTGSSSFGVLALIILFCIGGGLLFSIKDNAVES